MFFRNLAVRLSADVAGYVAPVNAAAASTDNLSTSIKRAAATGNRDVRQLAKGMVIAGGVILAALGGAAAMAVQFEAEMRNVNSIAGLTEDQFQATSDAVLDMATRVPQSAKVLAEGLYEIVSSGFAAGDALEILEASAVAATAGLTSTEVSAKAITAGLNAYGFAASQAGDLSDILFQTVNLGVLTFEELAGTIGDFVGMASAAGVGFDEANAALATMTLSGIKADEAGTSLNRTIQSFVKPSDAMTSALEQLGYESGTAAIEALGLEGVMEALRVQTGGNIEALVELFPEIRAARGALALMANEGENYGRVADGITDKTERVGATQRAFEEQSKSVAMQLQILRSEAGALAISFGRNLLPAIRPMVSLASLLVDGFDSMPGPMKNVLAIGLLLGGAMLTLSGAYLLMLPALAQTKTLTLAAAAGMRTFATSTVLAVRSQGVMSGGLAAVGGALTSTNVLIAAAVGLALTAKGSWDAAGRSAADMAAAASEKIDTSSLRTWGDTLDDLDAQIVQMKEDADMGFWEDWAGGIGDLVIPFHDVEDSSIDLGRQIQALKDTAAESREEFDQVAGNARRAAREFGTTAGVIMRLAAAYDIDLRTDDWRTLEMQISGVIATSQVGTPTTDALSGALDTVGSEAATATDQLSAYKDALDAAFGIQLSAFDAATRSAEAVDTLTQSLIDNGTSFDTATEQGRANRDALTQSVGAWTDQADAVATATGNIEDGNAVLGAYLIKLRDMLSQAGMTDAAIDDLLTGLGVHNLDVVLALADPQDARGQLSDLDRELQDLADGPHSIMLDDGNVPDVRENLRQFGADIFRPRVEVDPADSQEVIDGVRRNAQNFQEGGPWVGVLDVNPRPANTGLDRANRRGQDWDRSRFTSVLDANRQPADNAVGGASRYTQGTWVREFNATLGAEVGGSIGDAVGRALNQIVGGSGAMNPFGDGPGIGDGPGMMAPPSVPYRKAGTGDGPGDPRSGPRRPDTRSADALDASRRIATQRTRDLIASGGGVRDTGFGYYPLAAAAWQRRVNAAGFLPGITMGGGTVDDILAYAARTIPGQYGVSSTYRPGAITATGNRSYHAQRRAVDFTGNMPVIFEAFHRIGRSLKELIYSPAGGRQIWNGGPHYYGEPTRGDHWDHVHVAMANGGLFRRPYHGRVSIAETAGARPEIVTPVPMMRSVFAGELAARSASSADFQALVGAVGALANRPMYFDLVMSGRKVGEGVVEPAYASARANM